MGSVVAAFSAAWIILMVYLFTLANRQRQLRRALENLRGEAGQGSSG